MKKILVMLCIALGIFSVTLFSAESTFAVNNNINIGGIGGAADEGSNVRNLDKLRNFSDDNFIKAGRTGEQGLVNSLIEIARDLKNLFYAIATVFFLVICLKLIFSSNTEEELGKFKKGIIWITVGLIVMQLAYAFVYTLYDQGVSASLGARLFSNIAVPMIELVRTLASIFFIAMAIYAFYRMVTANGNEEAVKSAKMTILYALIGFIIVRLAQAIVEAFYGKINCLNTGNGLINTGNVTCTNVQSVSDGAGIIIQVINWMNSFVALAVLIMIIYAGAQILLSAGDEDKIKKGKQSLIYIAIGIAILMLNYLILTFFLIPETTI